ncbi:MAG: beta-ketoacyl-ACP synthase III [Deltaproteobacteria bacterium]|nr:beta-ketoacyl-ACP synthase III [Deltaproteobacteria bacterium]
MISSRIIGTGSYAPKKVLTNHDLEKMIETSDDWITERTGIKERRIAAEGETTSDMAAKAAKKALEMAGIEPNDIDTIIVATVTPDMDFPSTACFVQNKLKAHKAASFDIAAACSGFIYALSVADSLIKSGHSKYALVIGAEIFSRITDWTDRNTCILFGDGAGAAVLAKTTGKRGILSTHLHSEGSSWKLLCASSHEENAKTFIRMQGNEVFKVAVRALEDVAIEALEHNGLKGDDLDWFIPHQANERIIVATAKRLGVPMDKVYMNLQKYGNTSAASIPLALDEAVRNGKVKDGDLILLDAFGGGFTWASALIRW